MKSGTAEISARKSRLFFFEEYVYSAGSYDPLPAHSHPEYQIGLAIDTCGKYIYHRRRLIVPRMALSIFHSGVMHKPDKNPMLERPNRYRMLYVNPLEVLQAAKDSGWSKDGELPYFSDMTVVEEELVERYLELFECVALMDDLTLDVRGAEFLTLLVEHFSQIRHWTKKSKPDQAAVRRAQEYLDAHFTEQVSLEDLSQIAGLSKYHLCRTFRSVIGVAPHSYRNGLRMNFAKKLLLNKLPLAEIASELGFYDQSHFGKYFKHFSGVTPRRYVKSAIFS